MKYYTKHELCIWRELLFFEVLCGLLKICYLVFGKQCTFNENEYGKIFSEDMLDKYQTGEDFQLQSVSVYLCTTCKSILLNKTIGI